MTILVTVSIKNADQAKFAQVAEEHPELGAELVGYLKKHGNISHTRLIRDDEVLDLDEWPDEESFRAFLTDAGEVIAQIAALRGTAAPQDTVWRKA